MPLSNSVMDWDKLRIFHAVADAGSFTHAGHELGLSQSAVSRQISALEDALNVPLFHRHARGLILTEQGEMLYRTAHEVFTKLTACLLYTSILGERYAQRGLASVAACYSMAYALGSTFGGLMGGGSVELAGATGLPALGTAVIGTYVACRIVGAARHHIDWHRQRNSAHWELT